LRYGDVKKELFEKILEYFNPYRKKREEILSNKDFIEAELKKGKEKADTVIHKKITEVRKVLGISRV
jgi:tryptophanyl-tRNA synthetase